MPCSRTRTARSRASSSSYGGFLGFGEKGAVVGIDQLKLSDGTIITDLSEEQLSQRPEWKK